MAFGSESLSGNLWFAVLDSVRALSFGRRRRWVAIPFPGSANVAACLLNPPTLGPRRVGSFRRASIAFAVERKLYRGRGRGLVGGPQIVFLVFQIGGFTVGN